MIELKSIIPDPQAAIIFDLLSGIPDPEIPVISISDLGILRDVRVEKNKVIITITPTYSGCPAMKAIENEIADTLVNNGITGFEIKYTFSPAWTTDWMNEAAQEKLRVYGIAPPSQMKAIACPRCTSKNVEMISMFGSTACKALYRCLDCREPFDYFKCH